MDEKLRVRFRPTAAGMAVLLLSPFLLARDSAATPALIIGMGLLLLAALSLIPLLLAAPFIGRLLRRAGHGLPTLPESGEINRPQRLAVHPPQPRFLPGIRLTVNWIFRFGPFDQRLTAPLQNRDGGEAYLRPLRRGAWVGRSELRAGDVFGFFSFTYRFPGRSVLTVPPRRRASDGMVPRGRWEADRAASIRSREGGDERLEHRNYVPGDDTRYLNWKHYARTGELFIRVGEEAMPFRGRLRLLVVSSPRRRRVAFNRLDACLETADLIARKAAEENQELYACLPGESEWLSTADGRWSSRLAQCLPAQPSIPSEDRKPGQLLVIADPSDGFGITAAAAARTQGDRVLLVHPLADDAPFTLRGAFLAKGPGHSPGDVLSSMRYGRRQRKGELKAVKENLDVCRI